MYCFLDLQTKGSVLAQGFAQRKQPSRFGHRRDIVLEQAQVGHSYLSEARLKFYIIIYMV